MFSGEGVITGPLFGLGCQLPEHVCRISRSGEQYTRAGSAAEASKAQKYAEFTTGVDFIPVAIETSGTWSEQGFDLIREIGPRTAEVTHKPRATSFLGQRISVAIQRGNASCVMGTFRSTNTVATELKFCAWTMTVEL